MLILKYKTSKCWHEYTGSPMCVRLFIDMNCGWLFTEFELVKKELIKENE